MRRIVISCGVLVVGLLVFMALRRSGEPKILWSRNFAHGWVQPPTLASDGSIVCSDTAGNLVRFSRTGELLWETNLVRSLGGTLSRPIADSQGRIYVCSGDGGVFAVSTNGQWLWKTNFGTRLYHPPLLSSNGSLIVPVGTNSLQALSHDGKPLWKFQAEARIFAPFLAPDGTIYFSCQSNILDSNIYAVNPDGSSRYRRPALLPPYPTANGAIGTDGTIYVTAHRALIALNADGSLKWRDTNAGTLYSPVFEPPSTLYFRGARFFSAYDVKIQRTLWKTKIGQEFSNYIYVRGNTVFAASGSTIYAFDAASGKAKWTFARYPSNTFFRVLNRVIESIPGMVSGRRGHAVWRCAMAVSPDGIVYALMPDGKLYALSVE